MEDGGPRNANRSGRKVPGEPVDGWLRTVAEAASRDAGGVSTEFMGGYLQLLADAAVYGRQPQESDLNSVRHLGTQAATHGVTAEQLITLYLSAAWRLWGALPMDVRDRDRNAVRTAADAVLHVIDQSVAALVGAYVEARRRMVRNEETRRRELIDDLLRGDSHLGQLVERAEPFGLDLARRHHVLLAAPHRRLSDVEAASSALERRVLDWVGDRDVLVATKDGLVVVVAPVGTATPGQPTPHEPAVHDLGELMEAELSRMQEGGPWHVTVGRPFPGAYGIARSYEEAREALAMVRTLSLPNKVMHAKDLLVYRVLMRDQAAIVDLVHTVLGPLTGARDGAEPLLATLDAYFEAGGVATEAAVHLHLSVRAVTYRLERVRKLSGYDPTSPAHRFTVHAAVLGAKLLGWPGRELPT
jgi:sugar diacid utilization regulator